MMNRSFAMLLLLLLSFSAIGNTITISTAASSGSGWSYSGGVITASANVTINNATINSYLVTGNLTIEAGTNIVINADINPSPGGGITRTLTLRAGGNIVVEGTRTISCATGSLNMVLWSDTDEMNGGYIFCKSTSVLHSKGGHIWMGGGDGSSTWNGLPVGDGLARGSSVAVITSAELNSGANAAGFRNGITLYNNSVTSGGGHISLNGQGAALSNAYGYIGIYMGYNATVSSGAGNITIDGRADGGSSVIAAGWFYGILLIPTNNTNNGYGTVSIESTSGNITINGSARQSQNANHSAGVAMFTQSATATAQVLTHSGNMDITGSNLNVSNPSYGGIFLTGAGNENIVSRTGAITLRGNSSNSSVAGITANSASRVGYDGTNSYNGTIELIADNISFSHAAAALQSSGDLRIAPATASRAVNIGGTGGLSLPATFFTSNCINGFNSIRIGNSSYTGNMVINAVTFQDELIFETSGSVTQTGAITASGEDISFLGTNGVYTLNHAGNDVRSVAANTGSLQYVNGAGLELGSITTSGGLEVATLSGDLTITDGIHSDHTGTGAIRLYADLNRVAGDETGGNIIIAGTPAITTGAGGRASLYSGSAGSSTGLVSLVGGSGNVRMNVDGTTSTFVPVLGAGVYALFRAAASTLPVGLLQFDVGCEGGKAVLHWATATEGGNEGFYIEQGSDGSLWKTTGFVRGAGDSYTKKYYRFATAGVADAHSWYRLKQVDRNGKFTYSKPVEGRCGAWSNSVQTVLAFPNPAGRLVYLQGLPDKGLISFGVYNPQGMLVQSGSIAGTRGMIDLEGQAAGLYFIKLDDGHSTKMIRIIKQ